MSLGPITIRHDREKDSMETRVLNAAVRELLYLMQTRVALDKDERDTLERFRYWLNGEEAPA